MLCETNIHVPQLGTKDRVIINTHRFKARIAKNLKENVLGLLGTKKAYPLLLSTRFGIRTFGMKYPIDVLILDKRGGVKFLKRNLKPNHVYFWDFRYSRALELHIGKIDKFGIKLGDLVKLS